MEPLLHENVENFTIIITCNCISSLIERFQPSEFYYERKRPRSDEDEVQTLSAKVAKFKHFQDSNCLSLSSINDMDNFDSDCGGQWLSMPADISLVTESGSEFPVHHTIISKQSIYFSAMYGGYFLEYKLRKSYFKDVDDEAMIAMLLYLYGFNWRKDMSVKEFKAILCAKSDREVNNAVKVLAASDEKTDIDFYWNVLIVADRFLLNELKGACESYVTVLLKSHHMSNALLLSCIYCCKGLFTHCMDYFFRCATSVEQCDCFKLFPASYKEDFIKGVCNYVNEISNNNI